METASTRLPAKDLLLDPFLAPDDGAKLLPTWRGPSQNSSPSRTLIDADIPLVAAECTRKTDMAITGTVKPGDDSVYLKVQIPDKDGMLFEECVEMSIKFEVTSICV